MPERPTVTTVTGAREVPESRDRVWRALAVLEPYCAVCDVSYVVPAAGSPRKGTTFVCVPGTLAEGEQPAASAPRGEILDWVPRRRVTTRLDLTPEVWTTTIELADADGGGTRVTITVSHEPRGGNRLVNRVLRKTVRQLVSSTVDGELDKLPEHLAQVPSGS